MIILCVFFLNFFFCVLLQFYIVIYRIFSYVFIFCYKNGREFLPTFDSVWTQVCKIARQFKNEKSNEMKWHFSIHCILHKKKCNDLKRIQYCTKKNWLWPFRILLQNKSVNLKLQMLDIDLKALIDLNNCMRAGRQINWNM